MHGIEIQSAPGGGSGGLAAASQAEQETATSVLVAVTPGRQQFHPSAAKAWGKAGLTGNDLGSYNVTSFTDDGVGLITVTIGTDFSGAHYTIVAHTAGNTPSGVNFPQITTQAAGSFAMTNYSSVDGVRDPKEWFFAAFGDQ
jgi:hypothetical protein